MGARKMELFWPRQLMKRLLKSSTSASIQQQQSRSNIEELSSDEASSASDMDIGDAYSPKDVPAMLVRGISETLFSEHIDVEEFRLFVGTWNVAGRSPPSDLELEQWLGVSQPADIYVIGFQEMVPLNPGNVLGAEQDGVANKWERLIRRKLNKCCCSSAEGPSRATAHRRSVSVPSKQDLFQEAAVVSHRKSKKSQRNWKRTSVDLGGGGAGWAAVHPDDEACESEGSHYVRIVSKQMVGIFVTVWVRRDIRCAVRNVKVSCVGCGLMNYLGNKGSVSISMSLHETSFCFICAHLTSGERDGDEIRRNADVTEILRRTYFHRPKFTWPEMPETIMEHDRIIWFGDLNYRLAVSDALARMLISKGDWQALFKKDQLRVEKLAGRVFDGWKEGLVDFAPTYKYVIDSDKYSGELMTKPGERKRTPAWCDRILWNGKGLKQLHYSRAESRFSDHRPVKAVFLAEVEVFEDSKLKNLWGFSKTHDKAKELLGLGDTSPEQFEEDVVLPAITVF